MKTLLTALFLVAIFFVSAQTVPQQQPVEVQHHVSHGWWVLGVVLAIGVGAGLYMLIKKDPKRDAVR